MSLSNNRKLVSTMLRSSSETAPVLFHYKPFLVLCMTTCIDVLAQKKDFWPDYCKKSNKGNPFVSNE